MGDRMSRGQILTSHACSLPRPDNLIEANRARFVGETDDEAGFQAVLRQSVVDVVGGRRPPASPFPATASSARPWVRW